MRSIIVAVAVLAASVGVYAAEDEAHEKGEAAEAAKAATELAPAMKEAKVSLASGLKAAAKDGTPISGKYEVEDGKLQLSVYTMKGDKFFEDVVDHKTGKVVKSEPITGGEDLEAAKKQAEAMEKTKHSLRDAVANAEKANAGYKAVRVIPEIENGAAEAEVTLLKGTDSKEVDEKL